MRLAYTLHGAAPKVKDFQVAATAAVGVPLLIPAANGAGLAAASATSCANLVGVTLDAATYGTAQNADDSDPAAVVKVIINPDAVFIAKLAGGATAGTALTARTVVTASTTGLAVDTGFDYNSPSVDEGTIWGLVGANAGIVRKITSVSLTVATVTVAFPLDINVDDMFLHVPYFAFQSPTVTLTSDFTEIDCSVAISTSAAELVPIESDFAEAANSFVFLIAGDHALSGRPT